MKEPIVRPPNYETELKSFAKRGNNVEHYIIRGNTATELVDQFNKLRKLEDERGYDLFMHGEVYKLANEESEGNQIMEDLENMTRAQLLGQIMHLQEKCDRIEKENIRLGWIENPDRSGGQFTDWEINRRGDEFCEEIY